MTSSGKAMTVSFVPVSQGSGPLVVGPPIGSPLGVRSRTPYWVFRNSVHPMQRGGNVGMRVNGAKQCQRWTEGYSSSGRAVICKFGSGQHLLYLLYWEEKRTSIRGGLYT